MSRPTAQSSSIFNQIPGRAYLLIAVIIFGAANAVTRKLTELGAQYPIDGRNPISFCNVLFVGNVCALIALLIIYRKQLTIELLKQLNKKDWLGLIAVAVLAGALAPALFFTALELTSVNNVILIGRVEPPLVLALSVFLLGERVNSWVVAGAFIAFVGVGLTIALQAPSEMMMPMAGLQIGVGELLALGGAVAAAVGTVISKMTLREIPLGIFSTIRMAIGTVVFFVAVIVLFSPSHFTDVFAPIVWQWMAIYSLVIVVGGQLAWFAGLKTSGASEVSLANSFNPIAGILAAYLILGEAPTVAQYIGGGIIIIGIVFNQVGVIRQRRRAMAAPQANSAKEMEMEMGYRGV